MDNHFHLIWQVRTGHKMKDVQRDFLKYTAQQIKFSIITHESEMLKELQTNGADRRYQFWQRNSLSIPLYSRSVFEQKLDYIYQNPVKAGMVAAPWEYYYSSAAFYFFGQSDFDFLSHHVS
ncbi:transposase [Marinoscillum sp. MHG1-6]|uniref:transposase n=1 Tax=Marinoscillum sp. MHG1-6 TaxID=2959627 RepID=UPI0035BE272F